MGNISYHVCWFDNKEYDDEVCIQRRRSAKLYKKRGKDMPMPQCLVCTASKCKPGKIDKNIGRVCARCGVSLAGTTHQTRYCKSCAKLNERERNARRARERRSAERERKNGLQSKRPPTS